MIGKGIAVLCELKVRGVTGRAELTLERCAFGSLGLCLPSTNSNCFLHSSSEGHIDFTAEILVSDQMITTIVLGDASGKMRKTLRKIHREIIFDLSYRRRSDCPKDSIDDGAGAHDIRAEPNAGSAGG